MKKRLLSLFLLVLLVVTCLVGCESKQASVLVPSINVDNHIRFSVGGI